MGRWIILIGDERNTLDRCSKLKVFENARVTRNSDTLTVEPEDGIIIDYNGEDIY